MYNCKEHLTINIFFQKHRLEEIFINISGFVKGKSFYFILINVLFVFSFTLFIYFQSAFSLVGMLTFTLISIMASYFVYLKFNTTECKVEDYFLLTYFSFAILFVFINPIMQTPDEFMHFFRSVSISEGKIFGIRDSSNALGNYLPMELNNTIDKLTAKNSSHVILSDYLRIMETYFSGEKSFYKIVNTLVYFPTSYIPQTIGVIIARLFGLSLFWIITFGRIANAMFYALLSFFSIKIIRERYKLIMLFVSLMPMSVYLSCSFSTDSVLIASTLLFISIILRKDASPNNDFKARLMQYILGFIIILGKFTYFPLLLIHWIIDRKSKKKIAAGIIFDLSMIASAGIWNLFIIKIVGNISSRTDVNPISQVKMILEKPLSYTHILFETIYRDFDEYVVYLNTLGWLSHTMYFLVPFTVFLIFLYSITASSRDVSKAITPKIDIAIIVFSILFTIVLIETALYVTWTPIGKDRINGVQGRYFIPALPLIMISIKEIFSGVHLQMKNPEKKLALLSFIILTYTIIYMFINFWTSTRI